MSDIKVIPLVSIIVPVYKVKIEYLNKCIESLRSQTMKNIEIILVDDGSKDECSFLCDKFESIDSRITVIHQENQGVSAARNTAMRCVSSKYVTFIDSDDWIEENMCENAYNIAVKNNADIVFWSNCKEFINKTEYVEIYNTSDILKYDYKNGSDFNPYNMKLLGSVWGKLYSYEVIKELKFDENLTHGEDVEFNFRAFSKIKIGVYTNKHYYHYRYLDNSTVRTFKSEMIEVYKSTLIKIESLLKEGKHSIDSIQYKAFYTFVGIIYIVICSNYIFSPSNKLSIKIKIKELKKLTNISIFRECFANIDLETIPLTRRMPLICAKFNIFYGVYLIIKVRQVQCKLYNLDLKRSIRYGKID